MSKSKVLKVPLVGTLNLCLKMPQKMQKTRNESDHPRLRKRPKTVKNRPNSNVACLLKIDDMNKYFQNIKYDSFSRDIN